MNTNQKYLACRAQESAAFNHAQSVKRMEQAEQCIRGVTRQFYLDSARMWQLLARNDYNLAESYRDQS